MKDIQGQITAIGAKLQTCCNEIARRDEEIAHLKAKNAELVEMHLGKARRPPSLLVQRKRIEELTAHCQEFTSLKRNLELSLKQLQEKEVENSHIGKVKAYKQAEAAHLETYRFVQEMHQQLMAMIGKLEKLQSGHCLARLGELTAALGTEKLESLGVNINETINKFADAKLFTEFDGAKIANINLNTANLLNQLKAVASGKRVYSQVKQAPHPPKAPQVSRAQYARQLEQHRIKDMDALRIAKQNKKTVIHRPHA